MQTGFLSVVKMQVFGCDKEASQDSYLSKNEFTDSIFLDLILPSTTVMPFGYVLARALTGIIAFCGTGACSDVERNIPHD
jgi:hypothetical protein